MRKQVLFMVVCGLVVASLAIATTAQAQTSLRPTVTCSYVHGKPIAFDFGAAELSNQLRRQVVTDTPNAQLIGEVARKLGTKKFVGVLPGKANAIALMNGDIYAYEDIVVAARMGVDDAIREGAVVENREEAVRSAVAAVMAHEGKHTGQEHHTKNLLVRFAALIGLPMLAKEFGVSRQTARDIGALGQELAGSADQRDNEETSDLKGLDDIKKAGFDPRGGQWIMRGLRLYYEQEPRASAPSNGLGYVGSYRTVNAVADFLSVFAPSVYADHPGIRGREQKMAAKANQLAGGRILQQAPRVPLKPVGPMIVAVEDRSYYGYGGGRLSLYGRFGAGYYRTRVADVLGPAVVEELVARDFDVLERDRLDAIAREMKSTGYDLNGLYGAMQKAEVLPIARATDILIVSVVDEKAAHGEFTMSTGRFGRRDIGIALEQRKVKVSARLAQIPSTLIPLAFSKKGAETAFELAYRDFGIFNGVQATYGDIKGDAVQQVAKNIAQALRERIAPAPAEGPKSEAKTEQPDGFHAPEAAKEDEFEEREIQPDSDTEVFIGQPWKVDEITVEVVKIKNDGIIVVRVPKGKWPGPGKRAYPLKTRP